VLTVVVPCSNCLARFGTRVPFGTGEAEPWPHAFVSWPVVPSLCDFDWCCCDCLSAKLYLVCGAGSVLIEWACLLPGVVPSSGLVCVPIVNAFILVCYAPLCSMYSDLLDILIC
jgi:hypothetical protein